MDKKMSELILTNKIDDRLRDYWEETIYFKDGRKETYEVCQHFYRAEAEIIELWTKDDENIWIFKNEIKKIEFDKDWSHNAAIFQELREKEMEKLKKKQEEIAKNSDKMKAPENVVATE